MGEIWLRFYLSIYLECEIFQLKILFLFYILIYNLQYYLDYIYVLVKYCRVTSWEGAERVFEVARVKYIYGCFFTLC